MSSIQRKERDSNLVLGKSKSPSPERDRDYCEFLILP